jgi:hypothetical protein
VHLLTLRIQEPLPGHVLPEMIPHAGPEEAAHRYRAIVVTTLRQLRGLAATRIRLAVSPDDAEEAVRFWLLPRLAGRWQMDAGIFRTEGWEIDLGSGVGTFTSRSDGEILCPDLGVRWVHAALLGLGRSVGRVIGPATDAGEYFRAEASDPREDLPERLLPPLPVIRHEDDWRRAIDSPIGAKLRQAWQEETGREFPEDQPATLPWRPRQA